MNKLFILSYCLLQFGLMAPSVNKSVETPTASVDQTIQTFCEGIEMDMTEKSMVIKNLKAPHVHVDVYKVDRNNGWKNVFTCNDNCGGEQLTVNVEAKRNYIVHIKLFGQEWEKICERQMTLDASNNQTTCDDVSVVVDGETMTVGHLTALHQNVDIYQIEQGGAWTKITGCNDCRKNLSAKVNPKQKHLVLVKMFNREWGPICEKKIDYQP